MKIIETIILTEDDIEQLKNEELYMQMEST